MFVTLQFVIFFDDENCFYSRVKVVKSHIKIRPLRFLVIFIRPLIYYVVPIYSLGYNKINCFIYLGCKIRYKENCVKCIYFFSAILKKVSTLNSFK